MSQDQRSAWNVRGNYHTSLEERFSPSCKACTGCRMGLVKEMTAWPKAEHEWKRQEAIAKATREAGCGIQITLCFGIWGDLQSEVSNQGPREIPTRGEG